MHHLIGLIGSENIIINLVKLCVGAESVTELVRRQKQQKNSYNDVDGPKIIHVTRMWPRREKELLNGGSIYWVFKGFILARQKIIGLERIVGSDEIKRCGIILNDKIFTTYPKPKRPFQGWRYLSSDQAPADNGYHSSLEEELPYALQLELSRFGVR